MKIMASKSCEAKVNDCLTSTVNRTVQKPINLDYTNTFKEIASNVDKEISILAAKEKVTKRLEIAYLSMENLAKFDKEAPGLAHSFKKSKRDHKA